MCQLKLLDGKQQAVAKAREQFKLRRIYMAEQRSANLARERRFYVTWLRFTHGAGERSGNVDLERSVTVTGLRGDEVDYGT